jgi:hypothetical protein
VDQVPDTVARVKTHIGPLAPDSRVAERFDRFGEAPCAVLLEGANPRQHADGGHSRWFDLQTKCFESEALALGSVHSRRHPEIQPPQ